MNPFTFTLIALFALGSIPAVACDDICKAEEYYSDEAEMCVAVPLT